ncbi:unnamed protein product [marine sediment metagenome]|uniref:Uncharacterized protein n=1 Tax=marine sediment metagenome TaxID=412755 RepID=X0XBW3_9ZZZZ
MWVLARAFQEEYMVGPPPDTRGIWHYHVRIIDSTGAEREYSWHVAGPAGDIEYRFAPAVSEPGGQWQVAVTNLVTGARMERTFRLLGTGDSARIRGELRPAASSRPPPNDATVTDDNRLPMGPLLP